MFHNAFAEVAERLRFGRHQFSLMRKIGDSEALVYARGMAFVPMYAAYEYAVTTAVTCVISEINDRMIQHADAHVGILAWGLDDEMLAIRDLVKHERLWSKRIAMLEKAYCSNPVEIRTSLIPLEGAQGNRAQLEMIWRILGITEGIVPNPRFYGLITELIENRNGVCHGRLTPESVGRSYSDDDILDKYKDTQEMCFHVLQTVASHCSNPDGFTRHGRAKSP